MIRNGILFIYLLTIFSLHSHAKGLQYNLKDLEILESQGSYAEFINHAKDIRPSERNRHWKTLLTNSSIGLLNKYIKNKDYSLAAHNKVEELARWTELKSDEFFQLKRNSYQYIFFRNCFATQNSKCLELTKTYWNTSNKDIDTAYKLVQLLKGFKPSFNSWYMTKYIVRSKVSNFYCHKEIILNEILHQLHQQQRPNLINRDCLNSIKERLSVILEDPQSLYFTDVLKLFRENQLVNEERLDYYLSLYFLQTPRKGDLLNEAWARIQAISQDEPRRLSLVRKLLKKEPLPGRIFSFKGNDSYETFSKHFAISIPEYMDKYGKTCINYMSGAKRFPRGNPTLECRNLFDKVGNRPWVNQSLKLQYSAVKKY
ncbi:hypothetical protein OAT67_10000 [Bacteriovoracaceae bacterium]|nr:hypothetical protein [Bacteriovoracaceae bacterium]